jgi:hypothetical protein
LRRKTNVLGTDWHKSLAEKQSSLQVESKGRDMQVTADYPQAFPVPMNVSREADAAFLSELAIHDPQRRAALRRAIYGISESSSLTRWIVGRCTRCEKVIHNAPFLSRIEAGEFCSRSCRDGIAPLTGIAIERKGGRPRKYRNEREATVIRRAQTRARVRESRGSLDVTQNPMPTNSLFN